MKIKRILFLGNSITLHGPKPDIGWTSNCGMAASSAEHDYVHVFLKEWTARTGLQPKVMIRNIADFERQFDDFQIPAMLRDEIAFGADVVVIAIGENVPALTDESLKSRFKTRLQALLAALKTSSTTELFVRSCFWEDKTKDAILKQACTVENGIYVDISRLGKDEANYARSERSFDHAGVAMHPGDRGMQAIADALLKSCRRHSSHTEKINLFKSKAKYDS